MKKILILIIVATSFIVGCSSDFKEVVDFTTVVNPNLSEEAVVGQPNSSKILLAGIERQMTRVLNESLILSELLSDNYMNTQTFFNQFMDNLDIRSTDVDIRDTQFAIARLRELTKFGLLTVGPNDSKYNKEVKSEYLFFEGVSYMYAAMYFSYLPQEEKGVAKSSKENYESAIESFTKAIEENPKAEYYLARARSYYFLGDKNSAVTDAKEVITKNKNLLRGIKFDETDGPSNTMEDALYERSSFDDFQPLPRLDFLDPKYSFLTSSIDPSVYIFKSEEAHMIIAEAEISDSNLSNAKTTLKDLLGVVNTREVRTVDETVEQRTEVKKDSRPNKSTILVDGKSGLVIDRTATAQVASISGTSVTSSDIDALTNTDDALKLLYKMRQEIFIAEGIRSVDMGIKLIFSEEEIKLNPNVNDGDPGTSPVIPDFINSVKDKLDSFKYDKAAGTVTIDINVNDILINNKSSDLVLPFN